MSQENVENLRAVLEAWDPETWRRGEADMDAGIALLDPEVTYEDTVLPAVERIRAQRELEVTRGELASGALRGLGGEARRDAAIVDYLELPSTPATVEGVLARAAEDQPEAGAHRTSASLEQSIGRWREEGSDSIRSLCEEVFAEALELFGYEGSAARAGPAAETASG